jgi:hypothetical protein
MLADRERAGLQSDVAEAPTIERDITHRNRVSQAPFVAEKRRPARRFWVRPALSLLLPLLLILSTYSYVTGGR